MRAFLVLGVLSLIFLSPAASSPLFKVHCNELPLFRGRVDSIVSPGVVSNHVHRVFGGNGFAVETNTTTPAQVFDHMRASTCTTCSIATVDNSAYWHPELYYQYDNGTLQLIPHGGLTIYYEGRGGSGSQANPDIVPFPPGFRMVSGNPFRRSFNQSRIEDQAIAYACLTKSKKRAAMASAYGFPNTEYCNNGFRMQIHFPSCWNGKDVDSPDHKSHVAFPTRVDGGDCPATHPVRLMALFYEADYSISDFPPNNGQGGQKLVLSCGDSTGYGAHGDFLNGWDPTVLSAAIKFPGCDSNATNNGNNLDSCTPLAPYVQTNYQDGQCTLAKDIPLTEDLGSVYYITKLPGCSPITGSSPTPAVPCSAPTNASYLPGIDVRFALLAKSNSKYLRCPLLDTKPLIANVVAPSLEDVFATTPFVKGSVAGVTLQTEAGLQYANVDSTGVVTCSTSNSRTPGTGNSFKILPQSGGFIAIQANKNSNYFTVQADGTVAATSTTIGTAQLFTQVPLDGGHI